MSISSFNLFNENSGHIKGIYKGDKKKDDKY